MSSSSGSSGTSGSTWRKRKNRAVLAFILVAVVLVSIVGWWPDKPIDKGETCVVKPSTEPLLTKWVYDHSKQISRQGCKEVVEECLKTDKPLLMLALIEVESNFVTTASSSKGALGLTQIRATTENGKDVHEKMLITKGIIKERRDLFDIGPSIKAGDCILTLALIQAKGDVSKALEAYLGGQDVWYVKRILANLANLYILETGGKYGVVEKEKPMLTTPNIEKPKPVLPKEQDNKPVEKVS